MLCNSVYLGLVDTLVETIIEAFLEDSLFVNWFLLGLNDLRFVDRTRAGLEVPGVLESNIFAIVDQNSAAPVLSLEVDGLVHADTVEVGFEELMQLERIIGEDLVLNTHSAGSGHELDGLVAFLDDQALV